MDMLNIFSENNKNYNDDGELNIYIWIFLAIAIVISIVTSAYLWTKETQDWYKFLDKPNWIPEIGIFPMGFFLFNLINAYAVYRVYDNNSSIKNKIYLLFYGIQAILCIIFSWTFFSLHNFGWAIALIAGAIVFQAILCLLLFRLDFTSFWLSIIYLLWLIYILIVVITINSNN